MTESDLRGRIMSALVARTALNGGVVSRTELSSFDVDGEPLRLVDQSRGIWNPSWLDATLSIISDPEGPYRDEEVEGGLLRYDYRAGTNDGDNKKLRRAIDLGVPLILLRKLAKGLFVPVFPVFVLADDRKRRQFIVALDEALRLVHDPLNPTEAERRYSQRIAKVRLHQPVFRSRVILAYASACAICNLRHRTLLDAAHIVRDGDPLGQAIVPNGLSLCKIHHSAYDANLLGIDADTRVHVNGDLLREVDGPMLTHGLQEMHGRTLVRPKRKGDQPDRERLEMRFEAFRRAG